MINYNNVPLLL